MLFPFSSRRLFVTLMLAVLLGPAPQTAVSISQAGLTPTVARENRGPRDPAELTRFLDDFFRAQIEREHIAGAAVVVVRDGAILATRGYGYADVERHIPVDPERTILKRAPEVSTNSVNCGLVKGLPWSVFQICGVARASAWRAASSTKPISSVSEQAQLTI